MKTTKVILSILLAAILLFSALPMTVFADDSAASDLTAAADDIDTIPQSPDGDSSLSQREPSDDLAESGYVAGGIPGTTGSGTALDPVIVNTFQELKQALQYNQADLYIRVNDFPTTVNCDYYALNYNEDYSNMKSAVKVTSDKHLTINTDIKLEATNINILLYSLISIESATLYLDGDGMLRVAFNATGCPNAVFFIGSGGKLIVSGNPTIKATNIASHTGTYGRAIYNHMGEVEIHSGTFIGCDGNVGGDIAAVSIDSHSTSTDISGGSFNAVCDYPDRGYSYGLAVDSGSPNVCLTGGKFYRGIKIAAPANDNSTYLSNLLGSGYIYRYLLSNQAFSGNGIQNVQDNVKVDKAPTVTVSFSPNGGSGSMSSVSVNKGSSFVLPSCSFTPPANKVFDCWKIGSTTYREGVSVTINGNTTVYAQWKTGSVSGYTFSGTVTSYLSKDDAITLKLGLSSSGSNVTYTKTLYGNSASYSVSGISYGKKYTLSIRKKNHVSRSFTGTITGNTTKNVTINPLGDANLNGDVDIKDVNALYKHVMETKKITDPYAIQCGDVSKDYNTVDIKDVNALYKHVMETKVLY